MGTGAIRFQKLYGDTPEVYLHRWFKGKSKGGFLR